jgi:hypothetical protein
MVAHIGCNTANAYCTLSRYAAPSTGGFVGNSPEGCGREAALCWRDRSPFQQTPIKPTERRKQAAFGSPFLWFLSFGDAKERNSSVGTRTHIKIICRVSDTIDLQFTALLK